MHPWNLSPTEAIALQKELRERIDLTSLTKPLRTIAGADVSFNKYEKDVYAGIIVLSYPNLSPRAHAIAKVRVSFPYVPGLLSFREIPALLECWQKLKDKPDVIMVDGHGIAHPRRMRIATHFGLVTNHPSLGCAKSVLTGMYKEPAQEIGATSSLINPKTDEIIGTALRTKMRAKPVFISPGHKMTLENAVEIAKSCTRNYKLPEPTRLAHQLVNRFRKGELNA